MNDVLPCRLLVLAAALFVSASFCLGSSTSIRLPVQSGNFDAMAASMAMTGDPRVSLVFVDCCDDVAIFELRNSAEEPLFARCVLEDSAIGGSPEIVFGAHLIGYKPPASSSYFDVSLRWDTVIHFRAISPHTSVFYRVRLRHLSHEPGGDFRVGVLVTYDRAAIDLLIGKGQGLTLAEVERVGRAQLPVWSAPVSVSCDAAN